MRATFASICLLIGTTASTDAQVLNVNAMAPSRDFGILLGDILHRRVVVTVAQGTSLDDRTLPPVGPAGPSLDVRDLAISQTSAGNRNTFTIDVTYQTFVAPDQVTRTDAPGFTIGFSDGHQRFTAAVPGFAYAVSPFRHDLQPVIDPDAMRPDHVRARPDLSGLKQWLVGSLTIVIASACLLAADRYRVIAGGGARPFARAANGIARRVGHPDAASVQGDVRALHRAFDATAGHRVLAGDLGGFFTRNPGFAALRAEIDTFFAASHAIFFTGQIPPDLNLKLFARALARAESRT